MNISSIRVQNYRCFTDVQLELHDTFNVIVGVNGTGKTAILEAIRIALGSLFLKVDKYKDKISSPGIAKDDVRLHHLEPQFPVLINAEGMIREFPVGGENFRALCWERSLETRGGRTKSVKASDMAMASMAMQECIRDVARKTNIPIVAYYGTDRFKKEKNDVGVEPDGSRLRGYYHALDPLTNIKFFMDLWYTETLSDLQNATKSVMLEAVSEALKRCIGGCKDIRFDVKRQELLITMDASDEQLPFRMLSDGVRCMFAMVMELAFRCYLLNPHLGAAAAKDTSGVVLIDEIDLHLHPEWQKRVVRDLHRTFPKVQFIATTHAPLVVGSLQHGRIFSIKDSQAFDFPLQYGRDANYILREMGTAEMDETLKSELEDYFILIERGEGQGADALQLRAYLEEALGKGHSELQRADLMLSFF